MRNGITVVSEIYQTLEKWVVERSRKLVGEIELVELGYKIFWALYFLKCDGGLWNRQRVICETAWEGSLRLPRLPDTYTHVG